MAVTTRSEFKKNFNLDDHVVFKGAGELTGQFATVLGKYAAGGYVDSYIVLLDNPTPTSKAIVIIETCIDKVS